MPMYKRVMGALAVILLLVAGMSFYEYQQSSQAVDLSDLTTENKEKAADSASQAAIYVTGEVEKPGVVYVPQDGRVGDAINQCGGLLPTADSSQVNMAAAVKDGMDIVVRAKSLPVASNNSVNISNIGTAAGGKKNTNNVSSPSSGTGEMVNINTADADGLRKLKGIGPAMAQRIIDYREANGAFQSPEDLQQVKGIGKAKFAKLREQIAI
mgnify:CR=1 FL=1